MQTAPCANATTATSAARMLTTPVVTAAVANPATTSATAPPRQPTSMAMLLGWSMTEDARASAWTGGFGGIARSTTIQISCR
jgi:hypothetical protein